MLIAGNSFSFDNGYLGNAMVNLDDNIDWLVSNGQTVTQCVCPRISADKYTPASSLSELPKYLGRNVDWTSPGENLQLLSKHL